MNIKQLTKNDVEIIVTAIPEDIPVRGNVLDSGNDDQDRQAENEVIEKSRYSIWAWCCVKVTVSYKGLLSHDEYLGCCSYEDQADFIKNSGYYDDMVEAGISELQKQLTALAADTITC